MSILVWLIIYDLVGLITLLCMLVTWILGDGTKCDHYFNNEVKPRVDKQTFIETLLGQLYFIIAWPIKLLWCNYEFIKYRIPNEQDSE